MLDDDSDDNKDTNIEKLNHDWFVQFENGSVENPSPSDQTTAPVIKQTELQETQTKNTDLPPTDTTTTAEEVSELDQEILNLLGDTASKDKEYGLNIKNNIAIRWNHILTIRITKEDRKGLLSKYLIPENCKNMHQR